MRRPAERLADRLADRLANRLANRLAGALGGWLLALIATTAAADAPGWDSRRLSAPLTVDQRPVPYPEFAIYLMPGQNFQVIMETAGAPATAHFRGRATPLDGSPLTAPAEPGLSRLEITHPDSGEVATVNVFTMVPATRVDARGYLNGYRIGHYPARPLRGLDIYRPPTGFVEVTEANAGTRLSPNFTLGQFVSKQDQGFPKYVALRANLLLKLETILAELNRAGRPTSGLVVMSGFRTPWYNRAIGNVPYSRHVWGGAADIYVDQAPADGQMDDMNGDGKVNREDARWFATFVNRLSQRGEFGPRVGGIGVYGSNAAHGPFIHVDVRGTRARW